MRHEKAILIILAYVIGFVTAFIAFAINSKSLNTNHDELAATPIAVSAVVEKEVPSNPPLAGVLSKDDGLYVVRNGQERIVSARDEAVSNQKGFHSRIFSAELSPNNHYLHYCAEVSVGDNECVNYVYSFDQDMVVTMERGQSPVENRYPI